jgi:NAD(P)H dehydrogenase (quinone)
MSRIIDDWGLRYPGVDNVEHVCCYEVAIADRHRLDDYLRRSYELGRDFADPCPAVPSRTGSAS